MRTSSRLRELAFEMAPERPPPAPFERVSAEEVKVEV